MMIRALCTIFLLGSFGARPASAQLAPTGSHYAGRPSDTGFSSVSATGGLPTSIPLDFPAARGGLSIPISISYGGRGVGAAGVGWDLPLSFVRRDRTVAHRRPANRPSSDVQARERLLVSINGRMVEMVPSGQVWLARRDAPDLELRAQSNGWTLSDGNGQEFLFTTPVGTDLWLLSTVTSATQFNRVDLHYVPFTPQTFPGGSGISIELDYVDYNYHPTTTTCFKNKISLNYNAPQTTPLSLSLLGSLSVVRMRTLSRIVVAAKESCGAEPVGLRAYELSYASDVDTELPRLTGVRLFGRGEDTPESTLGVPVATYSYGSATTGGAAPKLEYQRGTDIALPTEVGSTPPIARTYHDNGASSPDGGETYVHWQNLLDVTGDGRPDLLFKQNGQLRVAMNRPAGDAVTTFTSAATQQLSDSVYSNRPLGTHSSESLRFGYTTQNRDNLWRQAIDVNGDGRLDIIDAAEESGVWTIYLNTPGNPVTWVKRKFNVDRLRSVLEDNGHDFEDGYVPLTRRTTGFDLRMHECWRWSVDHYVPDPDGFEDGRCNPLEYVPPERLGGEKTYTEWELRDINGDGYPDFVFNSSPVKNIDGKMCPDPAGDPPGANGCIRYGDLAVPGFVFTFVEKLAPLEDGNNKIKAVLNVVGVMFDDLDPFSKHIVLANNTSCGVALWAIEDAAVADDQFQLCGIEDVNGDGLVDRIDNTTVTLGTGDSFESSQIALTLPGRAQQHNPHDTACAANPNAVYHPEQFAGLRDLTGDGIPDFVANLGPGQGWKVAVGTGTGFRGYIPIQLPPVSLGFVLSGEQETCGGEDANTMAGLYDIDGDGKAELVAVVHGQLHLEVYHLAGAVPGNPQAGRLTSISNGYGATTNITYKSAKDDIYTTHQVPFPEIVVTSVETIANAGLGGSLSAVRYAYGDATLFFDPILDLFTMRAYGRMVEVHGTGRENWDADFAVVRLTNALETFSPTSTDAQRFERYEKVGRIRDTYRLAGGVQRDPWVLLGTFDPFIDLRRIAGTHNEWTSKYVPLSPYTADPDCVDVPNPYDWNSSSAWNLDHHPCEARGFGYVQWTDSWNGTQPPGSSASNVETRSEVTGVDNFGNVTALRNENDRFDPLDDFCVEMEYAVPNSPIRILSALAARRITNCVAGSEAKLIAAESWEFDGLVTGSVEYGRVTAHITERRATDTGEMLDAQPIRDYEIGYDAVGNASYIVTAREDGAVRSIELNYDDFGLAPIRSTVDASGIDPISVTSERDPLTLSLQQQTDANGTMWGSEYDGLERPTRTTVQPFNGTVGVTSVTSYLNYSGEGAAGRCSEAGTRSILTRRFRDPVPPADLSTAQGEDTCATFDEIGRPHQIKRYLESDYTDEFLVLMSRTYDDLGRVSFEADSYPSSQSGQTAYGTTYHYAADGALGCSIRGHGRQAFTITTNRVAEVFPTCFTRLYTGHTQQILTNTADSLEAGTPQEGTIRTDTVTAIGRLKSRETSKNGSRLELARFTFDRLGYLANLTRYGDPNAQPNPLMSVEFSFRHDSLGKTITSTEPQVATKTSTYSSWGELLSVEWTDTAGLRTTVESSYDALGRLSQSIETRNGHLIPEREFSWTYDTASPTPFLTSAFTVGRLTQTHSPLGDMHLSYDALGHVDGRAFHDLDNDEWYVEKYEHHADGLPSALEFQLPDTGHTTERYEYQYDTASRLKSVAYKHPLGDVPLYTANLLDPWGRVRSATYGTNTSYLATYADTGRRLAREETFSLPDDVRYITYTEYDAVGRELERSETAPFDIVTTRNSYDALGRLAQSTDPVNHWFDRVFTYDPLGNLTQSIDLAGSQQVNMTFSPADPDRLCHVDYGPANGGPCNVLYDENGNIVSQAIPHTLSATTRLLEFYPSGAVSQIDDSFGTATFRYDGSGEISSLLTTGAFLSDPRAETRFGLVRTRAIGTKTVIERQIPGTNGIVASRRGPEGTFVFPFADSHGMRTASDDAGFRQDVQYEPFGKADPKGVDPQDLVYTPFQWNGGDNLADFGVVHLGARMYDPVIGRFLSRDPLLVLRGAAGMNPYAFALNDPVNVADPTGLDCSENSNCNSVIDGWFPGWNSSGAGGGSTSQDIVRTIYLAPVQVMAPPLTARVDQFLDEGGYYRDMDRVSEHFVAFGRGLKNSAIRLGRGAAHALRHPVQTALRVSKVAYAPLIAAVESAIEIKNGVGERYNEFMRRLDAGDSLGATELFGEVVGDVAITAAPGASAGGALSRISSMASRVRSAFRIGGRETVSVYHGSIHNATAIRANGLSPSRSAYVTRDLAGAKDAIGPQRYEISQGLARDPGIIESRIPLREFERHFAPLERSYTGFGASVGAGIKSTEILIEGAVTELFNRYIVQ